MLIMKAVVQRVRHAQVVVADQCVGSIAHGLVVLLGVQQGDTPQDLNYLVDKVCGLRIFSDTDDKMNLSVQDVGGELLVISQFTLLGDCRKGKRPSFIAAAPPAIARQLYEQFIAQARARQIPVASGVFQADMQVTLCNDGPVTLVLDSRGPA